jgi:hypothetical protein
MPLLSHPGGLKIVNVRSAVPSGAVALPQLEITIEMGARFGGFGGLGGFGLSWKVGAMFHHSPSALQTALSNRPFGLWVTGSSTFPVHPPAGSF